MDKYKVVFVLYGMNFESEECSELLANELISKLLEKGIDTAYKAVSNPQPMR